jgi:ABC-type multidrug transport system fused ATPase/permease subunit
MLFRPLRFIADKVNTIQRGVIAAERVFDLLDKPIAEPHAKRYRTDKYSRKYKV